MLKKNMCLCYRRMSIEEVLSKYPKADRILMIQIKETKETSLLYAGVAGKDFLAACLVHHAECLFRLKSNCEREVRRINDEPNRFLIIDSFSLGDKLDYKKALTLKSKFNKTNLYIIISIIIYLFSVIAYIAYQSFSLNSILIVCVISLIICIYQILPLHNELSIHKRYKKSEHK